VRGKQKFQRCAHRGFVIHQVHQRLFSGCGNAQASWFICQIGQRILIHQRGEAGRWVFGAGAMLGSVLWFSALGFGARLLAPWFEKPIAWRILDSLIALVMLGLALSLLLGS
jgi:threonine/homoserine/homoserine lactone efflux protein